MRIAIAIAGSPTGSMAELQRHASLLTSQFRRMGIFSVMVPPGRGAPRALADADPDVVHVLHGLDGGGSLAGVDRAIACPLVLHVHPGAGATPRPDELLLARADVVVSPSLALLDELEAQGWSGPDHAIVPLGIDYSLRFETTLAVMPDLRFGNCSYAALEAVAARRLIVAPDGRGVREMLRDYRCGFTYDAAQPGGLDRLLAWLAETPAIVDEARAEMHYPAGVEDEAVMLLQLSSDLVAGTRRRARRPSPVSRLLGSAISSPSQAEEVARSAFLLSGWAVCDPGPVTRVDVTMNGRRVGPARLGLAQIDLAPHFPTPDAVVSGFELRLDLTELPAEVTRATFEVSVTTAGGAVFRLEPVRVAVADAAAVEACGPPETGPVTAEVPAENGRDTAVRLVVFTHDLGYGGAQLYLWEMLRQLVKEPWFSCTVVSPLEGPLSKDLRAAGIDVHVTSGYPVHGVDLYEGKLSELALWVRSRGFNLVMANTLLAFPAVDLAERLGLPSIWAVHESYPLPIFWSVSFPPHLSIHPYASRRAELALGSASTVVFVAESTRRLFQKFDTGARFVTMPYGIDLAAISRYRAGFDKRAARKRLGIPEGVRVLACIGVIQSRKAQTVIAQAFRAVADRHPDTYCLFVGALDDLYAHALQVYLQRAGLEDRTMVVPVVPDTFEWFGVSDLYVCASDNESMPRVALEAMAFDLPIAATRVFGLADLLEDAKTGHLGESRDVTSVADLLDRHLSAIPAHTRAMAREANRLVHAEHDSGAYARAYGEMFRRLVGTSA